MTNNDKEERMLLLKNGDILMFRKWVEDEGDIPCWCMELYYNYGKNLPLAPKTHVCSLEAMNNLRGQILDYQGKVATLEARIKELEARNAELETLSAGSMLRGPLKEARK
jgi:hypothetical protein